MKNKYISFVALAVAALATSCASDDLAEQKQEETKPRTVTLTASVNEGQTRVGMTKNTDGTTASFYWNNGDAISVLTTSGSFAKFTTTDADGTQKATFTGEVATGTVSKYAIYPYNANNGVSNNKFYCNLSTEYTYNKVESNIFSKDGSYPSNPTNMPMLGKIDSEKNSISFQCMGGLAVIRIDQMPAEKGILTVTADQQLSGKFSVDWSSTAVIKTTSENVSDADKQVTFNFSNAEEGKVGVFYLPLATGTYTNLKIVVAYGDNNSTTQTIPYGTLEVARAHVTAIPLSTDTKGNLRYIVKNSDGTYTINGHTFVDLGLSVLWATMNIGATVETGHGDYFAWGETAKKTTSYNWSDYKYGSSLSKYNTDGKTTLEAEDDAATANWGSGVRMPTSDEITELKTSGTWSQWSTNNSVTGRYVTGKNTNQKIFLPATDYVADGTSYTVYTGINYWSSSVYTTDKKYAIFIRYHKDGNLETTHDQRYIGHSVRAVAAKPTTTE